MLQKQERNSDDFGSRSEKKQYPHYRSTRRKKKNYLLRRNVRASQTDTHVCVCAVSCLGRGDAASSAGGGGGMAAASYSSSEDEDDARVESMVADATAAGKEGGESNTAWCACRGRDDPKFMWNRRLLTLPRGVR